ncbi:MAG: ribonuclease, partial [Candidatus Parcubacteria bacterium]
NVDRLTFSSIFTIEYIGEKVTIKDRWFGKTIINSDTRFSYEDAQKVINEKQGKHAEELKTLWGIAQILRKEKFKLGAIDFEADEVKFVLDEKGTPIRVYKKERLDTHKLVEEFMLLANREVAEFFYKEQQRLKLPLSFLYRIHDKPDIEKLTNLSIFLRALGYEFNIKKDITSKDIAAVLKKVEGKAEESLIKIATIRSMSKAVYSTANIGHFGLAFQYYAHFTSPIRRYPDLMVHRELFNRLSQGRVPQDAMARYQKIAEESSENEVRAAEAERASIKLKQVEYMKARIGEVFEGSISGVTEWGIYVEEINTKCEGMVKVRDMKDDFYSLDVKNYCLVGEKTKKKYSLSDRVKFKVVAGDLERRTLDYILV